ncbi:MAG: FAD:protein FMN transferase [Anaerolineales bacterium]|nr:FAD:protein FMN transferase [Anaerolineales bacterium]
MLHLSFRAMGCQMLALVDSESVTAADLIAQVPAWFESWESSLSRFRADSELMKLNAIHGAPVVVSAAIRDVFEAALVAEQESAGLVTPLVLDALESSGYTLSFEGLRERGAPGATAINAQPVRLTLSEAVHVDSKRQTLTLEPGVRLDFGGVAKGWAAEEAARRLSAVGPALVDAGGDIAVSGPRADGAAWTVAIADPQLQGADLGQLGLMGGGVATSGRDYRRWLVDGQWRHHLIDPRTGAPAITDVLSATVIAPTLRQAETAAKTLFMLGSAGAANWLVERPEYKALLVLEDGRLVATPDILWFRMTR